MPSYDGAAPDAQPEIVTRFLREVQNTVRDFAQLMPPELFNTFDYTQTGKNFSHPRVWGACVKAAWAVSGPGCLVEVDPRLNSKDGAKFQPDVVVRSSHGSVLLAVDIESPNSSDARLLPKDLDAYVDWVRRTRCAAFPYVVLTMLPKEARTKDQWQVLYLKGYNYGRALHVPEILKSPFDYWYGLLAGDAGLIGKYPITFANFDGRDLSVVDLRSVPAAGSHIPPGCPAFTDAELSPLLVRGNDQANAAKLVVERVARWLAPGELSSATPWPTPGAPESLWSFLGNGFYLGVSWPEEGVGGIMVWKDNARVWPGKEPARFVDVAGLRSRVTRLATWWNPST